MDLTSESWLYNFGLVALTFRIVCSIGKEYSLSKLNTGRMILSRKYYDYYNEFTAINRNTTILWFNKSEDDTYLNTLENSLLFKYAFNSELSNKRNMADIDDFNVLLDSSIYKKTNISQFPNKITMIQCELLEFKKVIEDVLITKLKVKIERSFGEYKFPQIEIELIDVVTRNNYFSDFKYEIGKKYIIGFMQESFIGKPKINEYPIYFYIRDPLIFKIQQDSISIKKDLIVSDKSDLIYPNEFCDTFFYYFRNQSKININNIDELVNYYYKF